MLTKFFKLMMNQQVENKKSCLTEEEKKKKKKSWKKWYLGVEIARGKSEKEMMGNSKLSLSKRILYHEERHWTKKEGIQGGGGEGVLRLPHSPPACGKVIFLSQTVAFYWRLEIKNKK